MHILDPALFGMKIQNLHDVSILLRAKLVLNYGSYDVLKKRKTKTFDVYNFQRHFLRSRHLLFYDHD